MDCNSCREGRTTVPFSAFESALLRLERANRRLWIIILLLAVFLFGSNAAWLWWESQWEDVTTTITQDLETTGGGDAIINDGVHLDGESTADSNN